VRRHESLDRKYLASGGLEMLFQNQKLHKILVPAADEHGNPADAGFLVRYLCAHHMKDKRKELFVLDDTVYVLILFLLGLCLARIRGWGSPVW
jgi:ubiquitin related modifier 1